MNNQRQFLLGIFFITALSILAVYTLFFTDTVSLFGKQIQIEVYFPEAHGLREGDPVQAAGLRIGRVTKLDYRLSAPLEERIHATLSLDEEIELQEGFRITIQESTLLGGRHVDIDPGEYGGVPVDKDEVLYGRVKKNPIEALADLGTLFTDNRANVASILENFEAVMSDVRDGKGLVGRLLTDETMSEDLALAAANIRTVTDRVEAGEGLLGALVSDEELADSVRGAVTSLQAIADDLRAGEGLAGRLIYDDALANEVEKGLLAFSSVGQRIDEGEGVLGRLISDEELAAELEGIFQDFGSASQDLQALTAQLRSGEGTLGKLMMDQELYDEALTAVGLLTRSLEDYREAAPVTAFTSVLFSAF
jgi:phospholipid/cholesterol/gamma-HCH transport system substrate-binding protein